MFPAVGNLSITAPPFMRSPVLPVTGVTLSLSLASKYSVTRTSNATSESDLTDCAMALEITNKKVFKIFIS